MRNIPFEHEVRAAFHPRRLVPAIVFVLIPVLWGLIQIRGAAFRDNFDIFSAEMTTPLYFVLPLVVTAMTALGVYQDTDKRFASQIRLRTSARKYVGGTIAAAGLTGFVLLFLFAFVAFIVAFLIWPARGNPAIMPGLYGLTPEAAAQDSLSRASYSQLLEQGSWFYGVAYALWTGLAGATLSAISICCLLVLRNRFLAVAVPFLIYFIQTLAAALAGFPHAALVYSIFPFGLNQAGVLSSAIPLLMLALLAVACGIVTTIRAPHLDALT